MAAAPPPSYDASNGASAGSGSGAAGGGASAAASQVANKTQEAYSSYRGSWKVSCLGVMCTNPGKCLYAELCLPCIVVSQRLELMKTHSPPLTTYYCCMNRVGGQLCTDHCACCGCGPHELTTTSGTCCLWLEAFCCFYASIPAHRREIEAQYGVRQGKEEWIAHIVGCLSFIPLFGVGGGFFIGYLACCCYACLAAQQEIEIEARGGGGQGPIPQTMS